MIDNLCLHEILAKQSEAVEFLRARARNRLLLRITPFKREFFRVLCIIGTLKNKFSIK